MVACASSARKNSSAEAKVIARRPVEPMRSSMACRIEASSSTMEMTGPSSSMNVTVRGGEGTDQSDFGMSRLRLS